MKLNIKDGMKLLEERSLSERCKVHPVLFC